ncbi:MAG: BCCT family transporter, partial [Peptococcaceae bacterium]|nr:BCCT family transporter [Peptococcaceae bacterium]
MSKNKKFRNIKHIKINPPVFFGSTALLFMFVFYVILNPANAEILFNTIQKWIVDTFGWFYVLAVALFLIFVIFLAISKYGLIKLGPDHSEPAYSFSSWFAMLFSAGMGIGLLFFGVAEPVIHYLNPPVGEGVTVEAAREAMIITFFHWGIHAWAIYAVVALSLAYFAFRHRLPLAIRSAFYPLIGNRINGVVGHAVDTFAVLGTIFGVATSMGLGVLQMSSGLNHLFNIPNTLTLQILLIVGIMLIATGSVVSGLDKGIKVLSQLNIMLAVLLLVFVFFAGPTIFLLQTLIQNTGAYISDLVRKTFNLYAYNPGNWIGGQTLFYWGWWISWAPFVGMFIARISRGRTIREFVTGVLMVPAIFTFIWMTVFGNTAIHMIMNEKISGLADMVLSDTTMALYTFLENLPWSNIVSALATLLIVTFFVTSADSGSLVVDLLTNGGKTAGPIWQRVYWAGTEGIVAIALLMAGGLSALQTAAIAGALPFAVVMLFMCLGLYRSLHLEIVKQTSLNEATLMPKITTKTINWQNRLENLMRGYKKEEVLDFMHREVLEVLQSVAEVFRSNNLEVEIGKGEDGRIWLEVVHEEEPNFFYSVRPKPYIPPSFVGQKSEQTNSDE